MAHIMKIDEWVSSDPRRRAPAGWASDPDTWTMIDTPDSGDGFYKVTLWWGSGYLTDNYLVWADDGEEALEKTAKYLEKTGDRDYEECQKLALDAEGDETFVAVGDGYLWSENLGVEEVPDEYREYVLNGGRDNKDCDNEVLQESFDGIVGGNSSSIEGLKALIELIIADLDVQLQTEMHVDETFYFHGTHPYRHGSWISVQDRDGGNRIFIANYYSGANEPYMCRPHRFAITTPYRDCDDCDVAGGQITDLFAKAVRRLKEEHRL